MTVIDWGSVADWVSGIGSLAAAVVALYIAHSSRRVRLRAFCGYRVVVGNSQPKEDVFTVSATNVSQRPTIVTGIGVTFGIWLWKRHGIILFKQDGIGNGIPKPLSDGESGTWNARLGPNNRWVKELIAKFEITRWSVFTWRLHIYTSNGGTTSLRPERNIRNMVLEELGIGKEH